MRISSCVLPWVVALACWPSLASAQMAPYTFKPRQLPLDRLAIDLPGPEDAPKPKDPAAAKRERAKAEALASATRDLDDTLAEQCNRFFLYEPPKSDFMEAAVAGLGSVRIAQAALARLQGDGAETPAIPCKPAAAACEFAWLIRACTERLDEEAAATAAKDAGTVAHADLIRQYFSYIRLRRWAGAAGLRGKPTLVAATPAGEVAARLAVEQLDMRMPDRLKKHALMQLFSAVLVSGPMFGDTSGVAGEVNDKSGDFGGLSTIHWQSAHWGSEDGWGKWDFSLGGRFGIQPVLLMVRAEDGSGGEGDGEGEAEPEHQQAVGYTMGVAVNRRIGEYSELSLGTRAGGAYLLAGPLLVDRGARDSYVALAATNGTGRTAWLWEAGLDFNLFNTPVTTLHIVNDLLSPQLTAGLAIRRDSRFRKDGDLVGFDDPEWRWVYRFMLDAVKVRDRRQPGEEGESFTFGFGVEYERALKGTATIPSATRFIIRGNVNLFKALKGGEAAEEEK